MLHIQGLDCVQVTLEVCTQTLLSPSSCMIYRHRDYVCKFFGCPLSDIPAMSLACMWRQLGTMINHFLLLLHLFLYFFYCSQSLEIFCNILVIYNISYSVAVEKLKAERPCKIRMNRENTEAVTSTCTCMLW